MKGFIWDTRTEEKGRRYKDVPGIPAQLMYINLKEQSEALLLCQRLYLHTLHFPSVPGGCMCRCTYPTTPWHENIHAHGDKLYDIFTEICASSYLCVVSRTG